MVSCYRVVGHLTHPGAIYESSILTLFTLSESPYRCPMLQLATTLLTTTSFGKLTAIYCFYLSLGSKSG